MKRAIEAWRQYAAGSEVDHFAKFCREHLIQSEDRWEGKPLVLEAWQRRMLGEALAYDSDGWPVWRSVVIIAPRKNGKTATLAALSLYRLLTSAGRPEILLAAPSDKVAGRLFDAAARFVRRSPELSGLLRVRDHAGEIVREDGMGIIYRLSSDPTRLYGYNPTHVVVDELAQWTTPNLQRGYAALNIGRGSSLGAAGVHDHDRRRGLAAARLRSSDASSTQAWTPRTSSGSPGSQSADCRRRERSSTSTRHRRLTRET